MLAFCLTSLRVITGPPLTTIILAPASAQANWIAAGLTAAAGVAVAGLAISRPRQESEAADETVLDKAETNGEQSHA